MGNIITSLVNNDGGNKIPSAVTVKDPVELGLRLAYWVHKYFKSQTVFQQYKSEQEKKFEEQKKKLEETELKLKESQSEMEVFKTELFKKIQEALEQDLNCIICTEVLIEPAVLTCHHIFCSHCIGVWTENGNRRCPLCRSYNFRPPLNPNGIESFIKNVHELLPQEVREHRNELVRDRTALHVHPVPPQELIDPAPIPVPVFVPEPLIEQNQAIDIRWTIAFPVLAVFVLGMQAGGSIISPWICYPFLFLAVYFLTF